MRQIFAIAVIAVLAAPASAQDATEEDDGLSLMERGARMLMEGMRRELEPALEGLGELGPALRDFTAQMGPALGNLLEEVEDWSTYHPPEILPNGDIIIRKKQPDMPKPPEEAPMTDEPIEL